MSSKPLPVLVLQGGGALGSYQAGVYEALADTGFCPEWIAGISIGAINAALIAGNPRQRRLDALRAFWDEVTSGLPMPLDDLPEPVMRGWHEWAAVATLLQGAPGFFKPTWPPVVPWLRGPLAFYDTAPLKATLDRLIDWDRLNSGDVRVSVGAVNVETGNFQFFDTAHQRLDARHIMASGALPPGLPPIEIDGQWWIDGGLVSNTPLDHVLAEERNRDMIVMQVDLFPARGPMPTSVAEVKERVSDIRFSSRTRLNTDVATQRNAERRALCRLIDRLPPDLKDSEEVRLLSRLARPNRVAIGQVIFREKPWMGSAKEREFSRATMHSHWKSGLSDGEAAVARAAFLRGTLPEGITSHDLSPGPLRVAAE